MLDGLQDKIDEAARLENADLLLVAQGKIAPAPELLTRLLAAMLRQERQNEQIIGLLTEIRDQGAKKRGAA